MDTHSSPTHGRHHSSVMEFPAEPSSSLRILLHTEPRQLCLISLKIVHTYSWTAWRGEKFFKETRKRKMEMQVKSTQAFFISYLINPGKKK